VADLIFEPCQTIL